MIYRIIVEDDATNFLLSQSTAVQTRIMSRIELLPFSGDIKRMSGRRDIYRLRVGSYRGIYRVSHGENTVYIENIGPRGDICKSDN